MDSALKLQLDVRNNAQDLQNYAMDLRNWEEEMKRKENDLNDKYQETSIPPPRNKIKRSKPRSEKNSNKPKKISAYDYSAWDKFDVEKACAEIDEEDNSEKSDQEESVEVTKNESKDEEDSSLIDSKRFSLIDEAFYEKEMGNEFVKKEQWADAIKCYTNAINLDSDNAIYYANRSLCFLKLKNFKSAETDATTAIQLDKNYIKAYQRRAFARQALGQLREAQSDYEQILKLEPKNALARVEFNKIDTKFKKELENFKAAEKKVFDHKNMFKNEETPQPVNSSKQQPSASKTTDSSKKAPPKSSNSSKVDIITPKPVSSTEMKDKNLKTESTKREVTLQNSGSSKAVRNLERGDGDKVASDQFHTAKTGVFKPLPKWCRIISPVNLPPHKRSKKPLKRINISFIDKDKDTNCVEEEKTRCLDVSKRESEKTNEPKLLVTEASKGLSQAVEDDRLKNERLSCEIPKTAIQFQKCWKILKKNPEEAYSYLKKIPGGDLPQIFENSLESDFFSQLITFLAGDEVKKEPDVVYNFLLGLTNVKRFSSLILFMSDTDKRCLRKAIAGLENVISKEDTCELLRLYELKV